MDADMKIKCNVNVCAHNCKEDSTCRLKQIQVASCTCDETGYYKDDTACKSYKYDGEVK